MINIHTDTYGCALIDAFGQRRSLRAKGELLNNLIEEHFAAWDAKEKETQRRSFVSLLNLDEYFLITYLNMMELNNNSNYSFAPDYEWLNDWIVQEAIDLIRNIRNRIKTVPENCRLYDNEISF